MAIRGGRLERLLEELGLGGVRPLRLPYESRSIDSMEEALRRASRGDRVVFLVKGLRDKLIVCRLRSMERGFARVSDELSGLRHEVPVLILEMEGCRLAAEWRRSRLVITSEMLEKCRCEKYPV